MHRHKIRVRGSGSFPIDMLRYDGCFPEGPGDAQKIAEQDTTADLYDVNLVALRDSKTWTPTNERWRSFMWNVVQHTLM